MTSNISSPILTILIPTRNRAKNLNVTLNRIVKSIHHAHADDGKVEVVLVNNFSSDDTEIVAKNWAEKYSYIKYYKHQEPYPSAEESLFHGIKYCHGEYIWSFGDDDYMYLDAVNRMLKVISTGKYNLVVQNFKFVFTKYPERESHNYIPTKSADDILIEYSGYNLFKEFGFCHVTAGFSLVCFKRQKFKTELFKKFIDTSKIYSYSATLFSSFCTQPAAFLSKPLVCMTANNEATEFSAISKVGINSGHLSYFAWSNGFIKILNLISQETKIPLCYLSQAREIIFSRKPKTHHQVLVGENLIGYLTKEVRVVQGLKTITNKKNLKELLNDYDQYFNTIPNLPGVEKIAKPTKVMLSIFNQNMVLFLILMPINLYRIRKIIKRMENVSTSFCTKDEIVFKNYKRIVNL